MHNFNIQQLRAFYALMNIGNVTRAAEHLNLTQPTVSRQLQLLEDALGFRVFDRKSGGRLVPTLEGTRLYEEIESTLRNIENLPEIANGIVEYHLRRLTIAATLPLLNSNFLIDAVARLRERHQKTMLHLERCRREHIEAFVARGDADIGLCALPISNPALKVETLLQTEAVAVLSSNHRLATREWLCEQDVDPEDLILTTAQVLRRQFSGNGNEPKAAIESPFRVHIALTGLCLAAAGQGVVVCDPLTADAFKSDRICILPWRPANSIEYGLITSRDRDLGPLVAELRETLKASATDWLSGWPH